MTTTSEIREAYKVTQQSGHELTVMTREEKNFYNKLQRDYLAAFAFTSASDLQDLDRLLAYELQVYRLTRWAGSNENYDRIPLTTAEVASMFKSLREMNALISQVKTDLGMTRASQQEDDADVGSYLKRLKRLAKEFGIHRERQLDAGISLMQDLRSKVHTFYRSNDAERLRTGFPTEAALVEWIRDEMIPAFDEVDAHFRANVQRYWAGTL